jgi:tripartite-type tricarboxylate transporter receptor subunit TctC
MQIVDDTSLLDRRSVILGASAAGLAWSTGWAQTEAFPSRPITIQVPYTPGASSDVLMRLVGAKISESVKQPVVIENRSGGGGTVAALAVKNAPPDGYTLFMGHSGTHVFTPVLFPKEMKFDPLADFAMVTPLIAFPTILVVPAAHPAKLVADLIALARRKEGGLSYASQGVGNTAHLIGEMFKARAGIPLIHVPYRGVAPALTDLVAGRVDFMFSSYISAGPHVEGGRLRMLAIAADKRSPRLPDLPTMAEAGVPGVGIDTWFGIMAPRQTPPAVVEKLNAEFVKAMNAEEVRKLVLPQVADIIPSSPSAFAKMIESDIARVQTLVKEAKIEVTAQAPQ